ncbi:STAS domain-containing protein [Saccharothrix sp. BKS2]|uniref:STAS domain-containing protein n=1 Tax=Saccharothrix sp. BKS2 TaxID=3064400 RepID=UPI0039EA345F
MTPVPPGTRPQPPTADPGYGVDGEFDRPGVAVRVARRRGVVFAGVQGDIDTDSYQDVRQQLFACLEDDPSALIVDLGGVVLFGSLGIAVLMEVHERAYETGVGFAVVARQRTVVDPMRVTEVDVLLTLRPTVDEALTAVRARSGQTDDGMPGPRDSEEQDHGFSWWSS